MLQKIPDVAGDLNVGAVLELRRQRLAVDDFQPRYHEVRAHRREIMRIMRPAPADQLAPRIAVAPCNGEPAPHIVLVGLEADEPPCSDAAHPLGGIAGKSPRSFFALTS